MKRIFNKLTNGPLDKTDFDRTQDGKLGFLVEAKDGLSPLPKDVQVNAQLGDIYSIVAGFDAVKELDQNPNVKRIEYSRSGGTL